MHSHHSDKDLERAAAWFRRMRNQLTDPQAVVAAPDDGDEPNDQLDFDPDQQF